MKKYVRADAMSDFDTRNKIGDAEPMQYEVDAEKALFNFKDYDGYNMTICNEDLIVQDGTGYYTVFNNVFGDTLNLDYGEDDLIDSMLDDDMTDFEIFMNYITTESPDAEDLNFYFNIDRQEIEGLLNLIQYEAKRCGWK